MIAALIAAVKLIVIFATAAVFCGIAILFNSLIRYLRGKR
jgi:hypothetical protein